MLAVLREAGVVDAGGAGLVELLRGIAAAVAGQPLPERPRARVDGLDRGAIHRSRRATATAPSFVVEGEGLDPAALELELDPLGDSLLVVGDATALKVHVHTDDPGARCAGTALGVLDGIEIANMHRQTEAREERLSHAVPDAPPRRARSSRSSPGDGNRRLFESLGAARRRRRRSR